MKRLYVALMLSASAAAQTFDFMPPQIQGIVLHHVSAQAALARKVAQPNGWRVQQTALPLESLKANPANRALVMLETPQQVLNMLSGNGAGRIAAGNFTGSPQKGCWVVLQRADLPDTADGNVAIVSFLGADKGRIEQVVRSFRPLGLKASTTVQIERAQAYNGYLVFTGAKQEARTLRLRLQSVLKDSRHVGHVSLTGLYLPRK